ncbi:MAG TPA: formylglycine-generating enzyme family protein, partial [Anaerolineae bacterium]|nr:formylglycine-generating enzyme family protein [Anaerolineae bacterium]
SGNVLEWTRSHYKGYPYVPDDGRKDLTAGDNVPRVLRGGSFVFGAAAARCPRRFRSGPIFRINDVGFRVAAAPCLPLPSAPSGL